MSVRSAHRFKHCFSRLISGNHAALSLTETCNSLLASMTAFFALVCANRAHAQSSFDAEPYKIDGGFNTPMSTIAGLTEWARDINHVYGITTIITIAIFFAVAIPVVFVVLKFKSDDNDETPPKQFHGNAALEFTWTIIPAVLLIFIAVPTWKVIFKHDKTNLATVGEIDGEKPLRIEAIGHQWYWEFKYPDQNITTASEIHFPENTRVELIIKSVDVLHSFWIPQMGGKVDAVPGKSNLMTFVTPPAKVPEVLGGDYYQGQCAELCGASHALMRFQAVVHTKDGFDRWAKAHNSAPVVATQQEKDGEAAFAKCVACHAIYGTPSAEIPGEKIGPNLSSFGSRQYFAGAIRKNTAENLALWLRNPAALKPGSKMPNLGLNEKEIGDLAAYLRFSTAKKY